jgi:hypothetical protein
MKHPEYTQAELQGIARWFDSMGRTKEGRRVVSNFESDENVPQEVREEFTRNLAREINQGKEATRAFIDAVTENLLLKGPPVPREHLDSYFSRLLRIRDLMRYKKGNIPLFTDESEQEIFLKWIIDDTLTIEELFKDDMMRGIFPVVWATFTSEVEEHLRQSLNIDDLCDKLGLLIEKNEQVIELRYKSSTSTNVRKPTVIEAGPYPAFRPSSREDPFGFTLDLSSGDFGLPEVVHEPIPICSVEEVLPRGEKERDFAFEDTK